MPGSFKEVEFRERIYGQMLMVVVTIILAASLVYPNIPESAPRANIFLSKPIISRKMRRRQRRMQRLQAVI